MVGHVLRIFLMCGVILSGLVFLGQSLVVWRSLAWAQKMLTITILCWCVYIADALRASLIEGLEWNHRLAFLAVGLVSLGAFLMEPLRSKRHWIGHPPEESDE